MNVALSQRVSLAEFLAWEERQELRYEFDGFQAYAMVGGTAAHSAIQANLVAALASRLRGAPCRAHGSELPLGKLYEGFNFRPSTAGTSA